MGAAISSVSYGASVIEKHLKFSKFDKSLDHQFSITPDDMKKLIFEINNAWFSTGTSYKKLTKGEQLVKKYRRSIYASKDIKKGEKLSKSNMKIIRPGLGLKPINFKMLIGKHAVRSIKFGEPIKKKNLT